MEDRQLSKTGVGGRGRQIGIIEQKEVGMEEKCKSSMEVEDVEMKEVDGRA